MSANASNASEKLWTPANVVTLVRICLVPVFVLVFLAEWPGAMPFWSDAEQWRPWLAAFVFVLLAATDALDGYLARSRGEVTNFGKFIDPLADKILVAAALLSLTELQILPSWVTLVILTREFIVSGIRMIAASQGVVIAASWYGKFKTVFQIIAIVMFILKDSIASIDASGALHWPLFVLSWLVMVAALVLTVVSMLDYFNKAKELLGFNRSGKRTKTSRRRRFTRRSAKALREKNSAEDESSQDDDSSDPEVLAARVIEEAAAVGMTIGTAESLTGGLIASYLTSVPGSSKVFKGSVVSYAAEAKEQVLGVPGDKIDHFGVVSEQVALAMAQGVREKFDVDVAVSVTGIAGPGGAEPDKPVGTVWMGRCDSVMTSAQRFQFEGDRNDVRIQTVSAALTALLQSVEVRME